MEETKKLFSQSSIAIATYFGGPAAAGYLMKKNYEAHDLNNKGKNAFFIGIISTILLFAGLFSIPENIIDKIPNALIPFIYTAIIYLIVEKTQGVWLKEHKANGGVFVSGWKAAGIGAIFMVILLAFIAVTAFIAGDLSKPDFDATTYDSEIERFSQNEIQSLAVFEVLETAEASYLLSEFEKGLDLWKENITIVNNLNAIENLPPELLEQNEILMKYCDLRVQHYKIIIKAISEDTDQYIPEIQRLGTAIEKVLEEL